MSGDGRHQETQLEKEDYESAAHSGIAGMKSAQHNIKQVKS